MIYYYTKDFPNFTPKILALNKISVALLHYIKLEQHSRIS